MYSKRSNRVDSICSSPLSKKFCIFFFLYSNEALIRLLVRLLIECSCFDSSLERRLEQEAQEVAALAAEARNARDVINRIRVQRRAVRAQRKHMVTHLASLKDTGKSMHLIMNTGSIAHVARCISESYPVNVNHFRVFTSSINLAIFFQRYEN